MRINYQTARQLARDDSGSVAVTVALVLVMLFGFAALGIDVGMLYRERAALQAKADMIALGTVPDLDAARLRAAEGLSNNGPEAITMEALKLGRYVRNPAVAREARFAEQPEGTRSNNAVTVSLTTDAPLYFAQVFLDTQTVALRVQSTATRTGAAGFSLGSEVARFGPTALSEALGASLGVDLALSAVDIDLLARTDIDTGAFLSALAEQAGFSDPEGNPSELLNQVVSPAQVGLALLAVVPSSVPDAVAALDRLALASDSRAFAVRDLIIGTDTGLGLTALELVSGASLSAADILSALAAPGATGAPVRVDAEATVDGVLAAQTSVSLGSKPVHSGYVAVGEEGVTLRNAAARLSHGLALDPSLLGALGVGIVATRLEMPVFAELAGTSATLSALRCTPSPNDDVAAAFATAHSPLRPDAGTSVAALYLGGFASDPMTDASPLDPAMLEFADIAEVDITIARPLVPDLVLSGVTIQARAFTEVGASREETITFTHDEAQSLPMTKTFGSGDLLDTAVRSLLASGTLDVRVKPGQSGLTGPLVNGVIAGLLDRLPAAMLAHLVAPVDSTLDAALDAAGVQVGLGALTLTDHICNAPKLVR